MNDRGSMIGGSMLNKLRNTCIRVVVLLSAITSTNAHSVTIDFESLLDLEGVSSQYASLGVTFSNATALTAGISLNEFEFPPVSGSNVVFDSGGMMSILFATSMESVGGYFTYAGPLTLIAYDATDAIVGSATSAFDSNQAQSGVAGSAPNEFLQLSSATGISRITFTGDPAGGSFTLDDLIFTALASLPPSTAVPEPATLLLFLVGGMVLLVRRKVGPANRKIVTV